MKCWYTRPIQSKVMEEQSEKASCILQSIHNEIMSDGWGVGWCRKPDFSSRPMDTNFIVQHWKWLIFKKETTLGILLHHTCDHVSVTTMEFPDDRNLWVARVTFPFILATSFIFVWRNNIRASMPISQIGFPANEQTPSYNRFVAA